VLLKEVVTFCRQSELIRGLGHHEAARSHLTEKTAGWGGRRRGEYEEGEGGEGEDQEERKEGVG